MLIVMAERRFCSLGKTRQPPVISVDGMNVEVGDVSELAHGEMYLGPTVSPDCAVELERV